MGSGHARADGPTGMGMHRPTRFTGETMNMSFGYESRRLARRFNASGALKRAARVLVLCSGLLASHAWAQSCAVGETPAAFAFSGGTQTLVVPAGVSSATVYLSGAQGGAGRSGAGSIGGSPNSPGGSGGLGGRVRGTFAVTPGSTLTIGVGGQGSQAVNPGGLGQGTDGIGGGATDLRIGATRIAVAGGGGGGGNAGWSTANVIAGGSGGVGGGGPGGAGATVPGGPGPFGGGGGAVGTGGGAGAGCGGFPATAGNATTGKGGNSNNFSGSFVGAGFGGGGGGGATIGAGGGGAGVGTTGCQQNWNGGGGGGSGGASSATGLTAVTINNGVQAGDGAALICLAGATYSVGGSATGQSGPVTLQLTGTSPASSQQLVVAQSATSFVFPTRLAAGANWTVSVLGTPAGQQCSVTPASGNAIAADVTGVALVCTTVAVTVNPPTLPNAGFNVAYSQTLSATSANGGTAPYTFAITAGATPPGLTLSSAGVLSGTPTAAGSFNFTVQATSSNSFSGTRAYTLVVAQGAQAITGFASNPSTPVFSSGGTFTVSATGGASGNPVVFASTSPAVCTVAGGTVTMVAAGSCALTANQAGNANYSAAPQATLSVAIGAATQTITNFAANPSAPVFSPGGTFTVSATPGASTSPVVFASTSPAVCTVSGNTVTMVAAGSCALTANQAGDANYQAAPQVSLVVPIGSAAQAITNFAANPSAPVYAPNGTFALSATPGASTSPVVFASTTPAVCTVSGSTATMVAAGSCGLTANQAGDANYDPAPQVTLSVAIGLAPQAITGFAASTPAPVYAPGGTFTVSATPGASTSPLVFASTTPATCTISGTTVTTVAAGGCTLTANQVGDANYLAAPQVNLSVAISVGAPVISWTGDIQKVVGEPDFTLPVPTSTSPGTFTYASGNPAVATVSGRNVHIVGPGVAVITASQAATPNYAAATATLTLTVADRPDPTREASVIAGLQAQIDASVRFASVQQSNVRDRMRTLRHVDGTPSHNGLSVSMVGDDGQSLGLPVNGTEGGDTQRREHGYGVWLAGGVIIGDQNRNAAAGGFELRSDGLTLGVDRAFGDWVLGFAAGAGWSDADFADARSSQDATQRSLMAYGLWRGGDHWHVDGMFGVGTLDFDLHRWSDTASARASARRDGDQLFGSSSVGYTVRGERVDITGYGRFDFSRTSLDAYRESGLGIYDLDYREQTIEHQTAALGVEGSHALAIGGRAFRPFWSIEYQDAVRNAGDARINYVVRPVSTDYLLGARSQIDDLWSAAAGFDLELSRLWRMSFQYRHEAGSGYTGNGMLLQISRGGGGGAMPESYLQTTGAQTTGLHRDDRSHPGMP